MPASAFGWGAALAVLLAVGLPIATEGALAQAPRAGGGAAENAQLLQQIEQIASERTTLQAQNAKLKQQIEAVRKDRDALKSGRDVDARRSLAADASLAHLVAERDARSRDLEQLKQRLKELREKFDDTSHALHDLALGRETARATLAARQAEFDSCVDRNQALYELNSDFVARFESARAPAADAQASLAALVEGYPVDGADPAGPHPR